MGKIVIVDLDGTLCNSAHREGFARNKEWEKFHSLLSEDEPHEDVAFAVQCLSGSQCNIVALTGRNEAYRGLTLAWFAKTGMAPFFDDILMRPDDDWRSDAELKPALLSDWLEREGRTADEVLLILEDRDRMVEAWRDLGFRCWQVNSGGY